MSGSLPVHRIEVRTGLLPRRVNCYLIDGDPLTLVDTGPASGDAWDDLGRGLAGVGRRVEEIHRVVITHVHIDHCGQAGRIARTSGAEVLAAAGDVRTLATTISDLLRGGGADAYRRTFAPLGVPAEDVDHFLERLVLLDRVRVPVAARAVGEGFDIAVGGERVRFATVPTPGHTANHVAFHVPGTGDLFGGDHILTKRPPNPLLEGTAEEATRRRSLVEYFESLERVRQIAPRSVWPGHWEPIVDCAAEIDRARARFERRIAQVEEALDGEERSAFDVARALYPDTPRVYQVLSVSMAAACLDVLEARGRVVARTADGVVRCRRGEPARRAAG